MSGLRELFSHFDADGNGTVSLDGIYTFFSPFIT